MRPSGDPRRAYLRAWHERAAAALDAAWSQELAAVGAPPAAPPSLREGGPVPSARDSAPVAVSKMAVEATTVGAIQGGILDANAWPLMRRTIAAELDASGTRLVPLDDTTFARKLASFERGGAEIRCATR